MYNRFQRLLAAALLFTLALQSCSPNMNLPITQICENPITNPETSPALVEANTVHQLAQTSSMQHSTAQPLLSPHPITMDAISIGLVTSLEEKCHVLHEPMPDHQREGSGPKSLEKQTSCLGKMHIFRHYNSKERELLVACLGKYGDSKEEKEIKEFQNSFALQQGNIAVFRQILDRFMNPHKIDIDGYSPLHYAAKHGYVALAAFLLTRKGADPNIVDRYGNTPLHCAADNGHAAVVDLLLQHHADLNRAEKLYGYTALHYAAEKGHTEVIQVLLNNRASFQATKAGFTPLHVAARKPSIAAVALLLNSGIDVDSVNRKNSYTPLHAATEQGNRDMIALLLARGANPNKAKRDGTTPLYIAAKNGELKVVELLLDSGAKPNQAKRDGTTPLYIAAKYGHLKVVTLLLDRGADPNMAKLNGDTPLCVVAENGHLEVVRLLLTRRADPNKANEQGCTPLHLVAENSLYPENTALTKMNDLVSTCWYHANKDLYHIAEIIHSLLEAGAEINIQNKNGDTFLHTIASRKKAALFIIAMLKIEANKGRLLNIFQDYTVHSESVNDVFPIILDFTQEVHWDLKNKQGKTLKELIQAMARSKQGYEQILQQLKLHKKIYS